MKGITIPEQGHIVQGVAPVDINGGVASAWLNLKNYERVDFILLLGVTGAASTITVEKASDVSGTGAEAIAFDYYAEETGGGDTPGTRQSATASGFATSTNDGIFYDIPLNSQKVADKPYVRVVASDPGAITFGAIVAILTGARFGQEQTPTAIT